MDTNYILHVLRNPHSKTADDLDSVRLEAANRIEAYHKRLRGAMRMLTALEEKYSNDELSKLGYQDFDEETQRFLRLANMD